EDHAEHGQQRAQLVHQQVFDAATQIGQPGARARSPVATGTGGASGGPLRRVRKGHRDARCEAGAGGAFFGRDPVGAEGLTSAISVPGSRLSTTARLSVHALIFTSRESNVSPDLT